MSRSLRHRRQFLKASAVAGVALTQPLATYAAPSLTRETRSRNDRIPIGLIGAGGMGNGNMRAARKWVDVVAIADADKSRQASSNEQLSQGKAAVYDDYRAILERDDIPVVHIATPDHWHAKPLIEAMLAGKDVYCEKPLTLTIAEGQLIRKIQKQTGRIVQVGTQQRSTFSLFTRAIALVAEGRLGRIQRIQCAIGGAPSSQPLPVATPPQSLDWDRWLGPAEKVDYREQEVEQGRPPSNGHHEFRWWYEYSGGKLTDWGAHHVDIANWALKANGQLAGPISISGSAEHPVEFKDGMPVQRDRYNTATKFNFIVQYPDNVQVVIRHDTDNGVLIVGDQGRIFVNRGKLVGQPVDDLKDRPLPENALQKAYKGLPMEGNERAAHWANFLHCHREQLEPISDVHSHMQMLNVCHLAGISARVGRSLKWDDQRESIVGDDVAHGLLERPYRAAYEIEM